MKILGLLWLTESILLREHRTPMLLVFLLFGLSSLVLLYLRKGIFRYGDSSQADMFYIGLRLRLAEDSSSDLFVHT